MLMTHSFLPDECTESALSSLGLRHAPTSRCYQWSGSPEEGPCFNDPPGPHLPEQRLARLSYGHISQCPRGGFPQEEWE